jgi:hypothetical protein
MTPRFLQIGHDAELLPVDHPAADSNTPPHNEPMSEAPIGDGEALNQPDNDDDEAATSLSLSL